MAEKYSNILALTLAADLSISFVHVIYRW